MTKQEILRIQIITDIVSFAEDYQRGLCDDITLNGSLLALAGKLEEFKQMEVNCLADEAAEAEAKDIEAEMDDDSGEEPVEEEPRI